MVSFCLTWQHIIHYTDSATTSGPCILSSRALRSDPGCPWGAHGREVQRARRARGAGHAAPHVRGAAFVGTIFIRHQHRQNHQKFNFRQLLLGYIRPQYFRKFSSKNFAFFSKHLQKIVIFEFFSLIFAQILMKFCRNFADNLENVEIF